MPNKSLDASGGSGFLNLLGAAQGALMRAAASTQPLGGTHKRVVRKIVTCNLEPEILETMNDTLQEKYVQVLDYSKNALELRGRLFQQRIKYMQGSTNPFKNPLGPFYYIWKESKLLWNPIVYFGQVTNEMREIFYASATEDQRNNPLFVALTSDSPMESLALRMKEDLDLKGGDAAILAKIHELTKKQLALSNPMILVPFLLGALAVLSKSIPKEVWDSVCTTCYTPFQVWTFIGSMGPMILYIILAGPFWFRYLIAKNRYGFCETLLAYRAILDEYEKDISEALGKQKLECDESLT